MQIYTKQWDAYKIYEYCGKHELSSVNIQMKT